MTLIINNHDVDKVLTMEKTLDALEESYLALAAKEAVCRPRIDIRIPTSDPNKNYQWGTMEGGSTAGYFAIRMKSDVIYETEYNGVVTQEKYCTRPGLFCGLILLTSIENGEPLAFLNDGHLQHMRVGGDGGIGVKYMANEDAEVVGILGSGGMARTHMQAFTRVRTIKKLQVFSPTRENREQFGREMAAKYNIEVKVCDRPEDVYKGAHIVAALTDSALRGDGRRRCWRRAAISSWSAAPASPMRRACRRSTPICASATRRRRSGIPSLPPTPSTSATKRARTRDKHGDGRRSRRKHGNSLPDKRVTLADLVQGKVEGPHLARPDHLFGARQPAGRAVLRGRRQGLRAAKRAGLGREIPTEWFLQDIRN